LPEKFDERTKLRLGGVPDNRDKAKTLATLFAMAIEHG
jgi:hypothetical protein